MPSTLHSCLSGILLSCIISASHGAELSYDGLIQESLLLRNSGDFIAAESVLRQAYPLANETNEVSYLLAMTVAFQGRFTDSIAILNAALQTYPNDMQLIIGKAQVLSYQGFYRESIDIADQALAQDATNIGALLLKARVYYYQRRYADARNQFQSILARDAKNLEALVGLYDVELAAGEDAAALIVLDKAEALAPEHIDITNRRQRRTLPLGNSAHILTASFGKSFIDLTGFDDWRSQNLEYRYRSASNHQLYLRREYAKRFDLTDTLYEIGGVLSGINSSLELSYAHTPDDEILPKQRVRLAGNTLLMQASESFGSTMLGISLTQSSYANGDVNLLKLDFTHYLLNVNAWLTPGIGIVKDEQGKKTVGWNVGAHWQVNSRLLLGYNYTDAPETELNVTTQTNSNHVYFRVELSDDTSLRLDLSRNTRQNSYTREAIAFSIQHEL
ncbi:MAG: YaiO family outer membrane beta-barrel protein [Gammaproteobacteria bacterium]